MAFKFFSRKATKPTPKAPEGATGLTRPILVQRIKGERNFHGPQQPLR